MTTHLFSWNQLAGRRALAVFALLAGVLVALSTALPDAHAQARRGGGYIRIQPAQLFEAAELQKFRGEPIDVSAYKSLVVNLGIDQVTLDATKFGKVTVQSANEPGAGDWQDLTSLTFTEGTDTAPKNSFATVDIDDAAPLARYIRLIVEFETATTTQKMMVRASAAGHP